MKSLNFALSILSSTFVLFGFTTTKQTQTSVSSIDVEIKNEDILVENLIDDYDFYYYEHGYTKFYVADTFCDDEFISIRYKANGSSVSFNFASNTIYYINVSYDYSVYSSGLYSMLRLSVG